MAERLGRRFGWLWASYAVSTFGTMIALHAFTMVAITVLHAGAAAVSLLAATGLVVGAVVAVPLGPWVDLHRKRPVMIGMDLIRFAAMLSVPVAYLLDALTLVQLVLVSVAVAAADITFQAASGAFLKTLLPPADLLVANGRFEGTTWTATVLGPPLGAAAIALFGPLTAVAADAVSYLLSALGLRAIGDAEPRPARSGTRLRARHSLPASGPHPVDGGKPRPSHTEPRGRHPLAALNPRTTGDGESRAALTEPRGRGLLSALGLRAIGDAEPRARRGDFRAALTGRRLLGRDQPSASGVRAKPPLRGRDLLDGWRFIFGHGGLRPLFLNTILVNSLVMATAPLLAVLMLGELGFQPWHYSVAFAVPCVGGLLGSRLSRPLVRRFGRDRVLRTAGALRVCWPAGLAFVHPGPTGLLLVMVVELGLITCIGVFNPVFATYRLEQLPAGRVARTLSAWSISGKATTAAMTALWGMLGALTGPRVAIAVAGLLILVTPAVARPASRG